MPIKRRRCNLNPARLPIPPLSHVWTRDEHPVEPATMRTLGNRSSDQHRRQPNCLSGTPCDATNVARTGMIRLEAFQLPVVLFETKLLRVSSVDFAIIFRVNQKRAFSMCQFPALPQAVCRQSFLLHFQESRLRQGATALVLGAFLWVAPQWTLAAAPDKPGSRPNTPVASKQPGPPALAGCRVSMTRPGPPVTGFSEQFIRMRSPAGRHDLPATRVVPHRTAACQRVKHPSCRRTDAINHGDRRYTRTLTFASATSV